MSQILLVEILSGKVICKKTGETSSVVAASLNRQPDRTKAANSAARVKLFLWVIQSTLYVIATTKHVWWDESIILH